MTEHKLCLIPGKLLGAKTQPNWGDLYHPKNSPFNTEKRVQVFENIIVERLKNEDEFEKKNETHPSC